MSETKREPVYVHCGDCEHEWAAFYTPLTMNANGMRLMKAASEMPCPMCTSSKVFMGRSRAAIAEEAKRVNVFGSIEDRALQWISGGDRGLSSETLWRAMMGREQERVSYPHDPDDFGRCARLLRLIPEWRPRISEMSALHPVWAALAQRWDEITAAMDQEVGIDWSKGRKAAKTYDLMKSIIRPEEERLYAP